MDRRWSRRLVLAAGILGTLLALYALAGFVLVPHLARHSLLAYGQRLPGSVLRVGAVRVNPFTLTAQVSDFALARPLAGAGPRVAAADTPTVAFDSLTVSLDAASLWRGAWDIRRIELDRPSAQLLIGSDRALQLPVATAPAASTPAPAARATASATEWPRIILESLQVRGGRVGVTDLSRGSPIRLSLDPIEFALADLRTVKGAEGSYRFNAVTSAGEHLDWSGSFSLRPAASSGQFAVQGLKVATLRPYLPASLPVTLQGGNIDLHGQYRWGAASDIGLQISVPSLVLHGSALLAPGAGGSEAAAPLMTLPELDVSDATLALPAGPVGIGEVRLRGATLQIRRNHDGSIDPTQLFASPAAAGVAAEVPATVPNAAATPGWSIQLTRLRIEDATLQLEDDSVSPAAKLRVQPVSLTVQGYDSRMSAPLTLALDAGFGRAGHLAAQATVKIRPLQADGQLDLQNFNLAPLQGYVRHSIALTIYRGRLGVQVTARYAQSPAPGQPQLSVTGTLSAADFASRDDALHADFLTGAGLQLQGLRYQQDPDALSIERVLARGVYGRVLIGPDGSLNLAKIFAPLRAPATTSTQTAKVARARQQAPATAPAASAAMPIRIGRVDIQNGSADFTDQSVQPNFSAAILGLRGSIVGLSSDQSSRASVNLQGSVNRYAPVSIVGQVNPLAATTYTDLTMRFQNIELTTFNPYSGKFAGYSIAQGKLTTQMHYHVDRGQLDATHHIEIDQLEFGPPTASKQAVPLPVKLAAALLKDRHGVISIDLPVTGTINDPKFRLGPIIWKAFVGLITKAVTAPFAWIGSLIGGGPQLAYVDFMPGSTALAADQAHKLAQLAQALAARPQLALNIPLHTVSDLDDQALAQAALADAEKTAATTASAPPATRGRGPSKESRNVRATAGGAAAPDPNYALVTLYRQHFQAAPDYPQDVVDAAARAQWLQRQLLPAFVPGRTVRDELARARAEAAQAAVLANHAVVPARVFLTQRDSGGGPDGVVRMQLQLQLQ